MLQGKRMAIKTVIIYMLSRRKDDFDSGVGGHHNLTLTGCVHYVAHEVLGIRYENLKDWVCYNLLKFV